MKFGAVVAVLLVSLFATSMAVPAYKRMAYYQGRASPQRMMYLQHYVAQPSQTHARSTAFVAGEAVGAGSYLKEDAVNAGQQTAEESVLNDAGSNEAEAYPAAGGQVATNFEGTFADGGVEAGISGADVPAYADAPELPEAPAVDNQVLGDDSFPSAGIPDVVPSSDELPSNHEAKVPREYNFENPAVVPEPAVVPAEDPIADDAIPAVPEIPAIQSVFGDQPVAEEAPVAAAPAVIPLAAAVPAVPAVAPPKRYLPPKRKITVKLDEQSEAANDDDEDVDADAYRPARVPNARRPVKGNGSAVAAKGTKAPLPAGTFFPVNFGGTSGGAIAIANSFSTGEGGSATSHAIAYGSPDVARAKGRPARRH